MGALFSREKTTESLEKFYCIHTSFQLIVPLPLAFYGKMWKNNKLNIPLTESHWERRQKKVFESVREQVICIGMKIPEKKWCHNRDKDELVVREREKTGKNNLLSLSQLTSHIYYLRKVNEGKVIGKTISCCSMAISQPLIVFMSMLWFRWKSQRIFNVFSSLFRFCWHFYSATLALAFVIHK